MSLLQTTEETLRLTKEALSDNAFARSEPRHRPFRL